MKTTPIPLDGIPIRLSSEFLSAFGPTVHQRNSTRADIMRVAQSTIIFRPVRTRRGQPTQPHVPIRSDQPSAQLSCHDAPIFRLLLKIAVSLTASNVTFSIFVRLRAANNTPINSSTEKRSQHQVAFRIINFPGRSHPSWSADVAIHTHSL